MSVKLQCPYCGRILGDTDKTTDVHLNCHRCKKAVRVSVEIVKQADYLPERSKK